MKQTMIKLCFDVVGRYSGKPFRVGRSHVYDKCFLLHRETFSSGRNPYLGELLPLYFAMRVLLILTHNSVSRMSLQRQITSNL